MLGLSVLEGGDNRAMVAEGTPSSPTTASADEFVFMTDRGKAQSLVRAHHPLKSAGVCSSAVMTGAQTGAHPELGSICRPRTNREPLPPKSDRSDPAMGVCFFPGFMNTASTLVVHIREGLNAQAVPPPVLPRKMRA